jgi:hypothetical protein
MVAVLNNVAIRTTVKVLFESRRVERNSEGNHLADLPCFVPNALVSYASFTFPDTPGPVTQGTVSINLKTKAPRPGSFK